MERAAGTPPTPAPAPPPPASPAAGAPAAHPPRAFLTARTSTVLVVIAGVAALYLASEVLIPVAAAVLLAFALSPLVRRLERWRMPRVAAVVVVMAAFLSVVGLLAWALQGQAVQLATDLPQYKTNIAAKLAALRGHSTGAIDKATATIKEIGQEIAKTPGPDGSVPPAPAPNEPMPVRVVDASTTPIETARSILGPVFGRLATAAIVVVFSVFILVQREELRNRIVRLLGKDSMHQTTPALDDAARRVSRYLLLQLVLNTVVGVLIGGGLLVLGVPGALVWGALTIVLRFIPYVGTWVGAAFPILVSLAVSPGWQQPLMTAAWISVVEVGCGQFLEPMLFGSGTGLTPLAVLASALFWGWLWGPVGLLLSTPIAVCLAVIGQHFPRLAFLDVLLSDKVALSPEAHLYQRMLANDREEAGRIVAEFHAEHRDVVALYDRLVLPALRCAELARHAGSLDELQQRSVLEIVSAIVDEHAPVERRWAESQTEAPVLCVGVRDAADTIAARMLVQGLHIKGVHAELVPHDTLTGELIEMAMAKRPAVVCLSAVPPSASMHTRVVGKRLRARFADLPIVAGLWTGEERPVAARDQLADERGDAGTPHVATTLAGAVATITALDVPVAVPSRTPPSAQSGPEPMGDAGAQVVPA